MWLWSSHTSPINIMLQWKRGKKNRERHRGRENWGKTVESKIKTLKKKKNLNLTLSYTAGRSLPLCKKKKSHGRPLPLKRKNQSSLPRGSLPKPLKAPPSSSPLAVITLLPSAPASRPRSQHLLHFWPPPCHWDFWLPKPEATQGSLVPYWSCCSLPLSKKQRAPSSPAHSLVQPLTFPLYPATTPSLPSQLQEQHATRQRPSSLFFPP